MITEIQVWSNVEEREYQIYLVEDDGEGCIQISTLEELGLYLSSVASHDKIKVVQGSYSLSEGWSEEEA